MWAQCLKIILVVALYSLAAQAQNRIADEASLMPTWWNSLVNLKRLEPSKRHMDKFWATRGKRGDVFIKPNALFTPMKHKNNMKPNGFFMMGKRSTLPNFFATYDDKRSISLKPNGIFALTKKSHWGTPKGLFGSAKRYMKPNGLFSITKRTSGDMEDLEDLEDYDIDEHFADELDIEDDGLELMPSHKREDELFLPAKAEKGPEIFWATRG